MTAKRLLLLLLIVLLSGLSGWLLDNLTEQDKEKQARPRHDPDFFMENFTVTAMNTTGTPRYKLSADKMKHYPDDDTSELSRPHIIVFRAQTPPWIIDANRGWISANGELVLLIGNVKVNRKASAETRAMSLTTEELRLRPNDDYAETDKAVTIVSGKDVTRAIGMRAYLKEGRLQLLSSARGKYDAKTKK